MIEALYDKEIVCLYCEKKFKTKKVRSSRVRVLSTDADFCIHYEKDNPYFYEINLCPFCGYAFSKNFKAVSEAKKEILRTSYFDRIVPIDLCKEREAKEAMQSYKLALVCASLSEESQVSLAGIYMRIAWLYRYEKNSEEEEKYLYRALQMYEEVYKTEDLKNIPLDIHTLFYLLGELNGRVGRIMEARKWFNMVLMDKEVETATRNRARDRWQYYKELEEQSILKKKAGSV